MSKKIIFTRSQKLKTEVENLKSTLNELNKEKQIIKQEILTLKDTFVNISCSNEITLPSSIEIQDKWLDDFYIQSYFDSFQNEMLKFRNDTLLIGPSVTQLLKHGSSYDNLSTLTSLSFDQINFAFLCVNNHFDEINSYPLNNYQFKRGSHWSLLAYSRTQETFYHCDSISGLNSKHALQIATNINPDYKFIEIETTQQINTFECGVHVLVNTKSELNKLKNIHLSLLFNDHITKLIKDDHSTLDNRRSNLNHDEKVYKIVNNKKKKIKSKQSTSATIHSQNRFSLLASNNALIEQLVTKESKIKKRSMSVQKPLNLKQNVTIQRTLVKIDNDFKINNPSSQNNEDISTTISQKNVSYSKANRKPHIKILSDSHGRNMRQILSENLNNKFNIFSSVKPNAKLCDVLNTSESDVKGMDENDCLIVIGGTNNIEQNTYSRDIVKQIEEKLLKEHSTHTNIILTALPYRYDIPILNKEIRSINKGLEYISNKYYNAHFLSFTSFNRSHYTKHGLHFNSYGKETFSNLLHQEIEKIHKCKNGTMKIPVKITEKRSFLGNTIISKDQH